MAARYVSDHFSSMPPRDDGKRVVQLLSWTKFIVVMLLQTSAFLGGAIWWTATQAADAKRYKEEQASIVVQVKQLEQQFQRIDSEGTRIYSIRRPDEQRNLEELRTQLSVVGNKVDRLNDSVVALITLNKRVLNQ